MKVPLLWLQDYVKTDKSPREIAAAFTQLGLMLDKPLDASGVLDLEHRMDRSDWLSILGCARDYAAFTHTKLNYPKSNVSSLSRVKPSELIEIKIESKDVRRFYTRVIKGIKVGPSPAWLKDRLVAYGIRSINNVVDITNYVMVEYGQPLHAQDISSLKKREIVIRPAKKGETITTILGTTIELDPQTNILTSGGIPTVIMGVVGGNQTGVIATTTDIILDAGNYDQSVIRKTSRRLKIINETVSRCDKFLDPRLCELAVERATYLIQEICGGTTHENVDYYPSPIKPKVQSLSFSRLQKISGLTLSESEVKKILTSLEYTIKSESKTGLTLEVPYFRTDIEVEDDLIADILRIYNYENIPVSPLDSPVPTNITPSILTFEDKLRDFMVAAGAHEHITTPLIKSVGTPHEVILSNALSTDQNALRTSMVPKLTEIQDNYAKHQITNVLVFEIGKTFSTQADKYFEHRHLTVVGKDVKDSLATLLNSLSLNYHISPDLQIISNKQPLGHITSNSYTLDTELLEKISSPYPPIRSDYEHITTRDLSLLVPTNLKYFDIVNCLTDIDSHWQNIESKSEPTQINGKQNYLLRLTWQSNQHVDSDIKLILQELKSKLGIDSKS